MSAPKRTIVIDYDDTLVKSSEIIIRILNFKNGTNKTINDLKDWSYRSIDKTLTPEKLEELYKSKAFWNSIFFCPITCLNKDAFIFLKELKNDFKFIVCSVGTKENIEYKNQHIGFLRNELGIDIELLGIINDVVGHKIDKSQFDFSDCYLFIDDNSHALESTNAPKKILLKNRHEVYWNTTPINDETIYAVNSFKEILTMIKFDLEKWR